MVDWVLETGIYLLGVALIPAIGLLLVCWGLWGDRSKGRARCPKCWYDMGGTVPRLECPECGHDAGHEPRLHKHHRRWGRVVIGVVLALLSAGPLAIVGGWWREQSAIRRCRIASSQFEQLRYCPAWIVDRVPDELTRVFDRGFALRVDDSAQFAACRSLRHLRLLAASGEQVTDARLAHLKGLSNLEQLCLFNTSVTGAGFAHLKGLSNLEQLYLAGAPVTDANLVHLKGLSNLKRLVLFDTRVTDAGLVHLKGLSDLLALDLFGTQVTDAGLAHLKGLSKLKRLDLRQTQVTDAGVAKLKQALPNLTVLRR